MTGAIAGREPMVTRAAMVWQAAGLVAWLVFSFGAATSGFFGMPGEWYAGIQKPAWNPPSWVFGPVWSALYAMMGVAAWGVWREGGWPLQKRALGWFLAQWALNFLWTPLFFGLHRMGWAFVEMLLLWTAIAMTITAFWRVRRWAAILLCPYLAWVSFAAVLNGTLWWLNR